MNDYAAIIEILRAARHDIRDLRQEVRGMSERIDDRVKHLEESLDVRIGALEQWRWKWVGAIAAVTMMIEVALKIFVSK